MDSRPARENPAHKENIFNWERESKGGTENIGMDKFLKKFHYIVSSLPLTWIKSGLAAWNVRDNW